MTVTKLYSDAEVASARDLIAAGQKALKGPKGQGRIVGKWAVRYGLAVEMQLPYAEVVKRERAWMKAVATGADTPDACL